MNLKSKQRGHSMTEWVVVTVVMVLALFAPIPGEAQSAVSLFMESIRGFYSNTSLIYSLP